LTWTDVANTPTSSVTSDKALFLYGSIAFSFDITYDYKSLVSFNATSKGKTIASAGKQFLTFVVFEGAGGGWPLLDDLNVRWDVTPEKRQREHQRKDRLRRQVSVQQRYVDPVIDLW